MFAVTVSDGRRKKFHGGYILGYILGPKVAKQPPKGGRFGGMCSLEIDKIYLQMDVCRRIFTRSAKILHTFSRKLQDFLKISTKSTSPPPRGRLKY